MMTRFVFCFVVTLWSMSGVVHGVPYMILQNTRPKCLGVIAAQAQTITIRYNVPDMIIPEDSNTEEDDPNKVFLDKKPKIEGETMTNEEDRLNDQWNKRMKEKLQRLKDKKMRETSITVSQKPGAGSPTLMSRQRRTSRQQLTGSGRIREELTQRDGVIEFSTGDMDGTVDICVQSIIAKPATPVRFSLHVTIQQTAEKEEQEKVQEKSDGEDTENDTLETKQVKFQMTKLERDLVTLNNRVQTILSNADFNKDQEVAFHEQSVAMNRASTYWPIIQLLVLVVTGFTQANHIVRFMKSRHIG